MPYLPDLERFFRPGVLHRTTRPSTTDGKPPWVTETVVEPVHAGEVVLPSGRIVACDHLADPGREPFTVTVEPGTYPYVVWTTLESYTTGMRPSRDVAALQVVVRDEPATRWEMALVEGQDIAKIADDDRAFFGFPVDAGVGTLASPEALAALDTWDEGDIEEAFIDPGTELSERTGVRWLADVVADEATGANVLSTQSGYGDGYYASYVGRGADDAVVSFVVWFALLDFGSDRVETLPIEDPAPQPAG